MMRLRRIASASGEFDLPRPINGRIKLNKVYSFALLRFVIRIAQHNWMRKWKKMSDQNWDILIGLMIGLGMGMLVCIL